MKALVTGASGFIGGAVARVLLDAGFEVRALTRSGSKLNTAERDIEVVDGDLRDPDSVRSAMQGCQSVFHVAGMYSLYADPETIWQINVQGTRNVLKAALEEGAERVIHTSSVATIGQSDDGRLADETWKPLPEHLPGPYKRSKLAAEQVAMEFASQGLDVVVVNPTFPIGAGDVKPTPTGQVIVDFLNGRLPAYVNTGINVVDVDHVALGHLLAYRRGRTGERYLLGNKNMTLREALEHVGRIVGKKAPAVRIPVGLAVAMSYVDQWIEGSLLKRQPLIPLEGVKTARHFMYVDCGKAMRELGMPQAPIGQAFEKAVRWFEQHSYIKPQKKAATGGKPGRSVAERE